MEPEYIKVAQNPPPNVTVANVDCQENNKLCSELGITKYPRIRFYQNGLVYFKCFFSIFDLGHLISTFEMEFNYLEMVTFAVKLSGPVLNTVNPVTLVDDVCFIFFSLLLFLFFR
jgi:hypothetical protein